MSAFIDLYGREVAALKKGKSLAADLSERLQLPEEALFGAAKLSVTAGRRILIENHCGIMAYGREYIAVRIKGGQIGIRGDELRLLAISGKELLIGGSVRNIEWS